MLFRAMLIGALYAALKDAVVAFNGVCLGIATHIFFNAAVDVLVRRVLLTYTKVELAFVSYWRAEV